MAIVYDSEYAAKLTQGLQQPKSNALLATMCNKLYQEEVSRRPIAFIWVRGHSANKGNDSCWYNGARSKGHTAASRYAARRKRGKN